LSGLCDRGKISTELNSSDPSREASNPCYGSDEGGIYAHSSEQSTSSGVEGDPSGDLTEPLISHSQPVISPPSLAPGSTDSLLLGSSTSGTTTGAIATPSTGADAEISASLSVPAVPPAPPGQFTYTIGRGSDNTGFMSLIPCFCAKHFPDGEVRYLICSYRTIVPSL
jgi:hypothetical protein